MTDQLKQVEALLRPYLKDRQECAKTRRILATHLCNCRPAQPLSLSDPGDIASSSQKVRGLQRDYVRALNQNARAKDAYSALVKSLSQQRVADEPLSDPSLAKQKFLDLVKARQKHNRLIIIQNYLETLNQQKGTSADFAMSGAESCISHPAPSMPTEVLHAPVHSDSSKPEIHELIDRLEKAVLRAKMLLKREQRYLRNAQSSISSSSTQDGKQLDALGKTRNELIAWIEAELIRAGDTASVEGNGSSSPAHLIESRQIQDCRESLVLKYHRYASLRQILVQMSTIGNIIQSKRDNSANASILPHEQTPVSTSYPTPFLLSNLEVLVALSNEQKSVVQQKSYVAVAFSKHMKNTGQILDRLAEESNLLSVYSKTSATNLRPSSSMPLSFADEVGYIEKPGVPSQAQAWVATSVAARRSLRNVVSDNLNEGGSALLDAQQHLLSLLGILGNDLDAKELLGQDTPDIWGAINGRLGVI